MRAGPACTPGRHPRPGPGLKSRGEAAILRLPPAAAPAPNRAAGRWPDARARDHARRCRRRPRQGVPDDARFRFFAAPRACQAAAERRDRYRVEAESIPQPEIAAALNSAAFHLDAALRQLEAEVAWHTATGLSVRSAGEVKISMLVLGQLAQAQAAADEAHLGDQIVREFMMNLADQLELRLAENAGDAQRAAVRSQAPTQVAPGFEESVAEYYRRLSRSDR